MTELEQRVRRESEFWARVAKARCKHTAGERCKCEPIDVLAFAGEVRAAAIRDASASAHDAAILNTDNDVELASKVEAYVLALVDE